MTESQGKVKIIIDPAGRPKIEGVGFKGNACDLASQAFVKAAAGGKEVHTEFKPEYYETTDNRQHIRTTPEMG